MASRDRETQAKRRVNESVSLAQLEKTVDLRNPHAMALGRTAAGKLEEREPIAKCGARTGNNGRGRGRTVEESW
jgi:hypothetical protein